MAKARVKQQDGERLDDEHIARAIQFLEDGGSKKEAYDILNIKANPTRFARIIEEYHERAANRKKLREANRNKPISNSEVQEIVMASLAGDSLSEVAESIFRSTNVVKNIIETVGIPQKPKGNWHENRFKTSIPDKCVTDHFDKGEILWSNKYASIAICLGEDDKPGVYHIYVIEKMEEEPAFAIGGVQYRDFGGFHAYQRVEELGSLRHLKEYGIDLAKPYRSTFPNWLANS